MAKRLIWLLLAALLGAAGWVLLDARSDEAEPPAVTEAPDATAPLGQGDSVARRTATDEGDATTRTAFDPEELRLPSFAGRVLDATGRPAAGAVVHARGSAALASALAPELAERRPSAAWSARTGADGRFQLPEAPYDGLYFAIVITLPGHSPLRLANQPAWAGRPRELGDLALTRAARASGRVLDADGRPIAGAWITAVPLATLEAPDAGLRSTDAWSGTGARSRADGGFRLDELPAAGLRLRAQAPDGRVIWSEPAFPPPGTALALDLIAEPARTLQVLVTDPGGAPLPQARVSLRFLARAAPPADQRSEEQLTDAAGLARFALPDGAHAAEWKVRAPGHAPQGRPFAAEDAAAQPLRFALAPLAPVRGIVLEPGGAPAAGAQVALLPARSGDLPPDASVARAITRADAAGSFVLTPDFADGDEVLVLQAWDGRHAPAAAPALTASSLATAAPFALRLGPVRAVAGRVLQPDGSPAAGARVALRRLHGPRVNRQTPLTDSPRGAQVWARATTDADGRFRFAGLPEFDAFLEAVLPPHAPVTSEDLALTEDLLDLELRLPAACGIRGQVEADLRDLPPLVVVASARRMGWLQAEVGADGRFELPRLAPAEWNLALQPAVLGGGPISGFPGGTPLARLDGVVVTAGATTPVILRLESERFGRLDGQVLRRGLPAGDLTLWLLPERGEPHPDPEIAALQRLNSARRIAPDAEGHYHAAALASGSWWVVVSAAGAEPSGWRDTRGRLDPRGLMRRRVQIEEGGSARCDFDLRFGTLRIRMSEARGAATLWLEPRPDEEAGAPRLLRIGPEGWGGELPAGAWTVSDFDRVLPPTALHVPPDGETTLEVAPDPAPPR